MSDYPEHEKLAIVAKHSQAIGQFLDWLFEQGVSLTKTVVKQDNVWGGSYSTDTHLSESIPELLARYFDIDRWQLEDEKRAMLDKLKKESPL